MARKRRVFSASFKARVALAAVRGDKTTAELASKFSVHTNQVNELEKTAVESGGRPVRGRTPLQVRGLNNPGGRAL